MINVYGLNPFAEAMLYYSGKANNYRVKRRLDNAIKRHPENKKALEAAAKPAKALEKLLDAKLSPDEALVDKFFKNIDGLDPYSPFGFCLASIMVFLPMINYVEYSMEDLAKYLRGCSIEERMGFFCQGVTSKNEPHSNVENHDEEEFSERIENLQISAEDKLKILNAAFTHKKHINELLSLIMPAAKLIESVPDEYIMVIEEFQARYSADNAQTLIESCFIDKLGAVDVTKVVPLILGFDDRVAIFDVYTPENKSYNKSTVTENNISNELPTLFCRTFIGIARHLIGNAEKNEIPALCEKIKALSDTTRLEMLFYLCSHKVYGQELCSIFDLGQSAVSYHVAKLLTAGFVTAELSGGKTYYSADKAGIQRMLDTFAEKIK